MQTDISNHLQIIFLNVLLKLHHSTSVINLLKLPGFLRSQNTSKLGKRQQKYFSIWPWLNYQYISPRTHALLYLTFAFHDIERNGLFWYHIFLPNVPEICYQIQRLLEETSKEPACPGKLCILKQPHRINRPT